MDSLLKCREFMDKFDEPLRVYIRDKATQDDRSCAMAMKKLWALDILTKDDFVRRLEKHGHLPIWKGSRFGWMDEVTSFMRGTAFRGKKRPEHSKVMKVKMKIASNKRSDAHKKNLSNFLKGEYYRKRVLTLNLASEKEAREFSIERLKALISSHNSKKIKSKDFRMARVGKFMLDKKYEGEELFKTFLNEFKTITLKNVEEAYSTMMSIISIVAMRSNPNMGTTKFFKKGTIKVAHCTNKTIISYRSSWELRTILFFEHAGIRYQYEPFYIPKGKGKAYLPDFVLSLQGWDKPVILEIKGFIRGKEGKKGEELKISSAITFAKENGYHYSYCKKPIESLDQIKNNLLT